MLSSLSLLTFGRVNVAGCVQFGPQMVSLAPNVDPGCFHIPKGHPKGVIHGSDMLQDLTLTLSRCCAAPASARSPESSRTSSSRTASIRSFSRSEAAKRRSSWTRGKSTYCLQPGVRDQLQRFWSRCLQVPRSKWRKSAHSVFQQAPSVMKATLQAEAGWKVPEYANYLSCLSR